MRLEWYVSEYEITNSEGKNRGGIWESDDRRWLWTFYPQGEDKPFMNGVSDTAEEALYHARATIPDAKFVPYEWRAWHGDICITVDVDGDFSIENIPECEPFASGGIMKGDPRKCVEALFAAILTSSERA